MALTEEKAGENVGFPGTQRMAIRARVVPAAAQGMTWPEIARRG
jgi:hypothetical protein